MYIHVELIKVIYEKGTIVWNLIAVYSFELCLWKGREQTLKVTLD